MAELFFVSSIALYTYSKNMHHESSDLIIIMLSISMKPERERATSRSGVRGQRIVFVKRARLAWFELVWREERRKQCHVNLSQPVLVSEVRYRGLSRVVAASRPWEQSSLLPSSDSSYKEQKTMED